jgi:hypothetical protein
VESGVVVETSSSQKEAVDTPISNEDTPFQKETCSSKSIVFSLEAKADMGSNDDETTQEKRRRHRNDNSNEHMTQM